MLLVKNIFDIFPRKIFLPFKVSAQFNNLLISFLLIYLFVIIGSIEQISGQKSSFLVWFSYIIIIVFFTKSISIKLLTQNFNMNTGGLLLPVICFIIWCLITSLLNGIDSSIFLITLKDYIKYILLYFAVINSNISRNSCKSFFYLLFSIILLQIPITVFQYFFIDSHPDLNCGTFGLRGTGQLLVFIVIAISGAIGYLLANTKSIINISVLIIILFIVPFFGSARAILYFLPLTLLCIGLHQKHFIKYLIITSIISLIATVTIFYKMDAEIINPFDVTKTSQMLLKENIGAGNSMIPGRLFDLYNVYNHVFDNYKNMIIGNGFGSLKREAVEFAITGKTASIGLQSQLALTLMETGIVGLILYFYIIYVAYKQAKHFFISVYSQNIKDPILYAISHAVMASIFMHIFCITYHTNWTSLYSSFPFWFIIALMYLSKRKILI